MNISKFVGKTFTKVLKGTEWEHRDGERLRCLGDFILFATGEEEFIMYHEQDCCESVYIEDVCGDLQDLVGHPILQAEEVVQIVDPDEDGMSSSWAFYKIATIKGNVTIRWFGTSNGYYSEEVKVERVG